ncbi:MAG: 5'/3'-nucleotidase SurE [Deltaproteobacteria bacterium]|nr:5'/3'-nucleotidase SurE [Deltaproteobacteria bacterium]
MRLLLSNDDGLGAEGLEALEAVAARLGEVWVVAPDRERSASSHALTMNAPLRARPAGERRWAVDGTPVDCAYLGVHRLLPARPDLVLSGINRGANVGTDVLYSGTVAVAAEACLMGIPAIALSMELREGGAPRWDTAARATALVLERLLATPLPVGHFLNVNIPDLPFEAIRGVAAARQVRRRYHPRVVTREDPWGKPYHWIGGPHDAFEDVEDGDGPLIGEGWITVSALRPQWNDLDALDAVRGWTDR